MFPSVGVLWGEVGTANLSNNSIRLTRRRGHGTAAKASDTSEPGPESSSVETAAEGRQAGGKQ